MAQLMTHEMADESWQGFLSFHDRVSADMYADFLESEEVPSRVQLAELVLGVEAEFCLLVPTSLAHRARWVLANSEYSESELCYLATGELGGE